MIHLLCCGGLVSNVNEKMNHSDVGKWSCNEEKCSNVDLTV